LDVDLPSDLTKAEFRKYRGKFCLSKAEGEKYREALRGIEELNRMVEEEEEKKR
jgi:hypothetical protein